jgi:hypothetical protein
MMVEDHEWDQLNLTLLDEPSWISMHEMRIACENRKVKPEGNRIKLSAELTGSIMEQRGDERRKRDDEIRRRRQRFRALGGIFAFGKGSRGCLASGKRRHSAIPLYVDTFKTDRILKVYAGFDSDVVYAMTYTQELWVWGAATGPTGLSNGQKNKHLEVKNESRYTFAATNADEDSDAEDPVKKIKIA